MLLDHEQCSGDSQSNQIPEKSAAICNAAVHFAKALRILKKNKNTFFVGVHRTAVKTRWNYSGAYFRLHLLWWLYEKVRIFQKGRL